ncbi:hypothetical protein HQ496_03335 [bacterium]|nr:hypothetical protein [bacterium]
MTSYRFVKASVLVAVVAVGLVPIQAQASGAAHDTQLTSTVSSPDAKRLDSAEWKRFGLAIEDALTSDHEGVQQSALRLIIAYSNDLNFSSSAVVDVMHLYREGSTEPTRRMAAVSLSKMKSKLALGFLERSSAFEQSAVVKTTIDAILASENG